MNIENIYFILLFVKKQYSEKIPPKNNVQKVIKSPQKFETSSILVRVNLVRISNAKRWSPIAN